MKCFLHIGTEKTATTTLQIMLAENREQLSQDGYCYPQSIGNTNHYKLVVSAYRPWRRDDLTRACQVYTKAQEEMIACQKKILKELQCELKDYPDATVIFSSEHLQSRLLDIDDVKKLQASLNRLGFDEIFVIVYLRNPSELANSLYSTAVRYGSTLPAPPPPDHKYWKNICDHQATLEKFGQVFGESALMPRIFHKVDFKEGSVVKDFLSVIGIHNFADYVVPQDKNPSLSALSIEILRRLNHKIPVFVDNAPNPLRKHLVEHLEAYCANEDKYVMSDRLAAEYEAWFRESNEWVRGHFFPHRTDLFLPRPSKQVAQMPWREAELDGMAEMIYAAWVQAPQEQSAWRRWSMKLQFRIIVFLSTWSWLPSQHHQFKYQLMSYLINSAQRSLMSSDQVSKNELSGN